MLYNEISIYIFSVYSESQLKRQMALIKTNIVSVSYKGQHIAEGGGKISTVINVITYTSVLHSTFFFCLIMHTLSQAVFLCYIPFQKNNKTSKNNNHGI